MNSRPPKSTRAATESAAKRDDEVRAIYWSRTFVRRSIPCATLIAKEPPCKLVCQVI
jgi:hypothetical protein